MKNIIYVIFIVLLSSCGTTKIKESDMTVNLSNSISKKEIVDVLISNGYQLDKANVFGISTKWKNTNIELTTFKVEIEKGVNNWKMKGKIKYEAYRDREMDESVYTEEYVYSKSDIFVIKYGWSMLQKISEDLNIVK